jgi:hypothetical protein
LPATVAIWLLLLFSGARAEPPAEADPSLAPFFHSLKQPGTNYPCCSWADCRPVATRFRGGGLEVFIGEQFPDTVMDWRPVPAENVIHGIANQEGRPIACWFSHRVFCFIDGGSS